MYDKTLLRPATLLMLIATAVLTFGCNDHVTAPESEPAIQPFDANGFSQKTEETTDVFDQPLGGGDLYAADAAEIQRLPNGIRVKVKMPTPEPGSYHYPDDAEEGPPEAFTLWVFVIDPDQPKHGENDWTGAFLGAGHVFGGPKLTLSGHISTKTEPFLGHHLENPDEADVFFRVAPHGKVDPDKLPEQIKTPSGNPEHWWEADFF